jgi:gas vesicle protein
MSASRHRTAFIIGVLVGGTAGIAASFLNAPQSGRRTRDQIQQSAERVIFKVLDMIPYQHVASDTVTSNRAGGMASDGQAPVDVVLASRPSEMGMNQSS